jgi:heme-degrading monooxygenase HmoA
VTEPPDLVRDEERRVGRPVLHAPRKLARMVAAMSTVTGAGTGMAELAQMAQQAIEGWLREYEGYRGLIVFTDEEGERARVITLWDTPEAEARARQGRGAMRDQVAAVAGMVVEGMELYDVPVLDVLPELA